MTPKGEFIADPRRGAWMGNRGCLHDEKGRIGNSRWSRRYWLTCRLEWKNIRRTIMAPGRYTELFFLDEPTALAAGHRPCKECRSEDYRRFAMSLAAADGAGRALKAKEIDDLLHADRLLGRSQRTFQASVETLPDGAMVDVPDMGSALVWGGQILEWTMGGYARRRPFIAGELVTVLTPAVTVRAIAAGYRPVPHFSALRI